MKERPIRFSRADDARAILEGRMTQTRRVLMIPGVLPGTRYAITSPEEEVIRFDDGTFHYLSTAAMSGPYPCPYGKPGDRLWVREPFATDPPLIKLGGGYIDCESVDEANRQRCSVVYRADWDGLGHQDVRWYSTKHMPRWASRIMLEITDVRVQRLQEITHDEADASGCCGQRSRVAKLGYTYSPREQFSALWDSTNAARGHGWETNPLVWAISFRTVECPSGVKRESIRRPQDLIHEVHECRNS